MNKISVFHMNQLGDLLFSLPVLKALRKETKAKIYSVVPLSLSPLLKSVDIIDGVISKDQSLFALIKELKAYSFDAAVLFSQSPSSFFASYFSRIPKRFGFSGGRLDFLLTSKTKRVGVPSMENDIALAKTFGLKNISSDYTGILKIPEENLVRIQKWFSQNNLNPQKTVVVAPCSSRKRTQKQLGNDIWGRIIDSNSDKCDFVLSGAYYQQKQLENLAKICKQPPKIFFSSWGILDVAALFKTCAAFLGIDSGAMHLAAAVGTKCIGIFVNTDPLQIGPRPRGYHTIIGNSENVAVDVSAALSQVLKKYYKK
jgi:ADP-heptose:LPS heptosyltransferase